MNGIGEAALEIQSVLERCGLEFCVIGGLAVVCWGEPRATQDVDFSVLVPLGDEQETALRLLESMASRIENAATFAAQSRVLLAKASNGTSIDIAFAAFPFEREMIRRAEIQQIQPGLSLRLITAEDLIVTKAIAGRPQDEIDIRGILDRQGDQLDRQRIANELLSFAELLENDEALTRYRRLLDEM